MQFRQLLTTLAVAAIAFAAGWGGYTWWAQGPDPRELTRRLEATVFPADYARIPDITLQTGSGPLSRSDLAGRWTLLYFGFTHCPDVCPTTLRRLSVAMDDLRRAETRRPRVLFVSVDYRRDSPAEASGYAEAFGADFLGATAAEPVLRRLAERMHVTFSLPDEPANAGYSVEHSSAVFLLDPRGRVRALFGAPQSPATLASEYRVIHGALAGTS